MLRPRLPQSRHRRVQRRYKTGHHLFTGGAFFDPAGGWKGFHQTGSGMGLSLQVAGQRRAYALSDIGTFLAYQQRIGLELRSRLDGMGEIVGTSRRIEEVVELMRRAAPARSTILVVDDTKFGRAVFYSALNHAGYVDVRIAESAPKALETLATPLDAGRVF